MTNDLDEEIDGNDERKEQMVSILNQDRDNAMDRRGSRNVQLRF